MWESCEVAWVWYDALPLPTLPTTVIWIASPSPSLPVALGRAGTESCLSNTMELTLDSKHKGNPALEEPHILLTIDPSL